MSDKNKTSKNSNGAEPVSLEIALARSLWNRCSTASTGRRT